MSSIRLFILSSFAELGPMHGHRLRLEAERNHVTLWTEISVGAVYGAMSRLAAEGLLQEVAQEREGNRPTRQVFAITDAGRAALDDLRRAGLSDVWFRHDPFDLALTRATPDDLARLPAIVSGRLAAVRAKLADTRHVNENARPHVGLLKLWALRHAEVRLEAEERYLADLLAAAPAIAADETARRAADAAITAAAGRAAEP